jgi:hypothetical protein
MLNKEKYTLDYIRDNNLIIFDAVGGSHAYGTATKDSDVDKLISFHAYGPKFTEFKGGEKRVGSTENEEYERGIFGNVTEVVKFNYDDLKIAMYGDVANVTFHSDFHFKFGEDLVVVNDERVGQYLVLGSLVSLSQNPATTSRFGYVSPLADYDGLMSVFVIVN